MMAMDGIEKGEEEENATLEPGGREKPKTNANANANNSGQVPCAGSNITNLPCSDD